jgi:hypothetical protein
MLLGRGAMPLGQTGDRVPDQVYRVDAGRPPPPAGLSWNQGRQECKRGGAGEGDLTGLPCGGTEYLGPRLF